MKIINDEELNDFLLVSIGGIDRDRLNEEIVIGSNGYDFTNEKKDYLLASINNFLKAINLLSIAIGYVENFEKQNNIVPTGNNKLLSAQIKEFVNNF